MGSDWERQEIGTDNDNEWSALLMEKMTEHGKKTRRNGGVVVEEERTKKKVRQKERTGRGN